MAVSEGIEWAAHVCTLLAALPDGRTLSVGALAEFHGLPRPYLAKHLQALARAGLVRSSRGARGGFALARRPAEISLLDVYVAIEGDEPKFRCQNIRRRGPCPTPASAPDPCSIAAAFWRAEQAHRQSLRDVTIADIVGEVARHYDAERATKFFTWLKAAR